jgi:uncharacterized oxidoreductase
MQELGTRILRAAGADPEAAAVVSASLVASDLRGVHSHGSIRLPDYLAGIHAGAIAPTARPRIVADGGPLVSLDGCSAFGQVAAHELVRAVVDGAREHGVCLGTLAGVAHVGRLGEWVERVADEGLLALAWCNCGDPGGNVAPYGAAGARLGTNPMAYAIPAGVRPPIVADFSTSTVAEGKVRLYRHAGERLPDGWVIDADGRPTDDPEALYAGGALLPAAGHKGYALALLVEILGGVLAGGACASLGEAAGNGLVLLAVDPARSAGGAQFATRVDAVADVISSLRPAPGGDGVLLPGAPEREAATRSQHEGYELSHASWREIADAARSLGIDPDV